MVWFREREERWRDREKKGRSGERQKEKREWLWSGKESINGVE